MLSQNEEFDAWCEWRMWSSVLRVLEPYSFDEIRMNHWVDELPTATRRKYYKYLMSIIFNRSNKRAKTFWGKDFTLLEGGNESADSINDGNEDGDDMNMMCEETDAETAEEAAKEASEEDDDGYKGTDNYQDDRRGPFVSYFDWHMTTSSQEKDRIRGKEDRKKQNQPEKTQQDYVFQKVKDATKIGAKIDSLLAIIVGCIFGSQNTGKPGIIKNVLLDYFRENYPSYEKRGWILPAESLYSPIESCRNDYSAGSTNDIPTYESTTPSSPIIVTDETGDKDVSSFESLEIYRKLFPIQHDPKGKEYQRAEKIILVARGYDESITNSQALFRVLGHKKEYVTRRKRDVFNRLQKLIANDDDESRVLNGLVELIMKEFEKKAENGTEKEAFAYLYNLEKRDSNGIANSLNVSTESTKGMEQ